MDSPIWRSGQQGTSTGNVCRSVPNWIRDRLLEEGTKGKPYGVAFSERLLKLAMTQPRRKYLVPLHTAALKFVAERIWPKDEAAAIQVLNIQVATEFGAKLMERLKVAGPEGHPATRGHVQEALRALQLPDSTYGEPNGNGTPAKRNGNGRNRAGP